MPSWGRLGRHPFMPCCCGLGGAPLPPGWGGLGGRPMNLVGLLRLDGCQPGGLDTLHSAGPGCGRAGRASRRRSRWLGREPVQAHTPGLSHAPIL